MNSIQDIHREAMSFARKATDALEKNDLSNYRFYTNCALGFEKKAALELLEEYDSEPTRSVLFMSAASLAMNIEKYVEARYLLETALLGKPFQEIERKLKMKLEIVNQKILNSEIEEFRDDNGTIIRIALLDMYEGVANLGMRSIREIVYSFADNNKIDVQLDEFDVRLKKQLPGLEYDIYISSSGPGNPLRNDKNDWEELYFEWLNKIESWNNSDLNEPKKQVFFIGHSFQLACLYFDCAKVCKRKSTAFGVFPIHLLQDGVDEPVFSGLNNPFFSVESRDYQVISPNYDKLNQISGAVLAIEKDRPHVPLERAIMALRFNKYMIGTQFHPEAAAIPMTMYLHEDDKKKTVINNYGVEKWVSMIEQLSDPEKVAKTSLHILPNFLFTSIENLQTELT